MRFQRADRPSAGGVRPAPAQPVFALMRPGDAYEREADRMARQVADGRSRPASAPTRPSLALGQRDAPAAAAPSPGLSLGEARGGGRPLPPVLRSEMEQSFRGTSFTGVRIHADARSDQMSRSLQARAFTSGRDIFFREGAFDPGSHRGRELIAHELTHVVHQTSGDRPPAASPVIQRYMADDWADADASTERARGNRDGLRSRLSREGWTGAAHVAGAVLDIKGTMHTDPNSAVGFSKRPAVAAAAPAQQARPENIFDLLEDLDQDETGQAKKSPAAEAKAAPGPGAARSQRLVFLQQRRPEQRFAEQRRRERIRQPAEGSGEGRTPGLGGRVCGPGGEHRPAPVPGSSDRPAGPDAILALLFFGSKEKSPAG
jgi:hypothetical protein